ncbi:hypothetical protein AB0D49_08400 [Streptomyces sp. NPDC048290]|uniref:hypothetical protein n=1 Tax=Streptomyces sp. NPDC048290 TaxID=3155811 RepID=UPI003412226F
MTQPDPTETARYRHRTAEVEAVQWTGSNAAALRAFCGPDFDEIDLDDRVEDPDESAAVREGKHGTWRGLKPGDWVVKLDEGLYEFSADDFAGQYEPAGVAPATDRAALRQRIAVAIARYDWNAGLSGRVPPSEHHYGEAEAVLPVLPAPADRAAALRDVEQHVWELARATFQPYYRSAYATLAEGIGRMAAEAQQPEPDDTGLTETGIDRMTATGTPAQIVTTPPDTPAAGAQQQPDAETLAAALDGMHTLIATSSRDWGTYRVDAWLWAVLCGWDCEETEHDDTCTHGTLEEMAARHGWDTATVAKARRYRSAVRALTAPGAAAPATERPSRYEALKNCICTPTACPPHCPCHADAAPAKEA